MKKIESLSDRISRIKDEIGNETEVLISNLKNVTPICIDNNTILNTFFKKSGCYLFEIQIMNKEYVKNNFKNFMAKWNKYKNNKHKNKGNKIPSFNKSNAKEVCQKINGYTGNWFPLYVGKAEDLSKRIGQHIKCNTQTTYALRVGQFKNANNDFNFRVKWIELHQNIIYYCEKNIHKKLHPLIGKG